ncbi:hydroxycinnamoyltransferase 4 isoform X2 [Sorghum bicolor]|uniref:Uncharacterized protein n=1 Tax=Sorghum bicolor TaxID=4558 RepID=A0A1W0VW97_SORBI|nr:hydroxycinnamoyltransferase 4 isoform X2 [Sorghum bicolor]OQU86384.1 hypothetical protein SORBI_3003G082800 [Sorghum bicolor]OQU86385.1 hypothetical protein SORBI_3003G082800 [Sorghum bicolor]|eukprot:XP_021311553.1 hydroxycinnamoyltransferase 4 isoform X2 [Sorghum bicolor]
MDSVSEVQLIESSFVVPKDPTPWEGLWLSPLDLVQAKKGHTPVVYLYSSNNIATADDFFDVVARLKEAMAKALVAFYPLAGRLGVDNHGRVEITCNGEGALFVVAHAADLTIGDIKDDFRPSPKLKRLFVPRIEPTSVVLAIQVTFLKCGGMVLGTALHHVATDALSPFHFLQTWTAFSRHGDCATTVELPCQDRTPPPCTVTAYRPPKRLLEDQVVSLKRLCGGTSTFCAISALVWQCTCVARRLPLNSQACLTFPANVRRRDIASEALASVAGRIKGAIDGMDDKLVQSAIDYYEMMAMAETDSSQPVKGSNLLETNLHITSWLGMPLYDADFGWGKPWVMLAEYNRGGFVHLMSDGPADDASVRVIMCMEAANMNELERLIYEKLSSP